MQKIVWKRIFVNCACYHARVFFFIIIKCQHCSCCKFFVAYCVGVGSKKTSISLSKTLHLDTDNGVIFILKILQFKLILIVCISEIRFEDLNGFLGN